LEQYRPDKRQAVAHSLLLRATTTMFAHSFCIPEALKSSVPWVSSGFLP
jgi:hypothetical protein